MKKYFSLILILSLFVPFGLAAAEEVRERPLLQVFVRDYFGSTHIHGATVTLTDEYSAGGEAPAAVTLKTDRHGRALFTAGSFEAFVPLNGAYEVRLIAKKASAVSAPRKVSVPLDRTTDFTAHLQP